MIHKSRLLLLGIGMVFASLAITGCDSTDQDGDSNDAINEVCQEAAPLHALQDGVCAGTTQTCDSVDGWVDDYGNVAYYEATEVSCDDLDNDCDGTTDMGLCDDICPGTAPLHALQDGVCAGTTQTCNSINGWLDNYASITDYEATEISCDNLDNDCDGSTDIGVCAVIEDPNELITDRHFARGLTSRDPDSGDLLGPMDPAFADGETVWSLGQWGSSTNLADLSPTTLDSGAIRWADDNSAVTIGPAGSTDADLSFRVNAYEEYGGSYRTFTSTQTWAHLLAEQRLTPLSNGADEGCPYLSDLGSLDFSVDARLLFDHQNKEAGYDDSKHAADYLMYFTIQNRNAAQADGYGDFLWFGLTVYGDRDASPGLYVAGDDFSGKLIYNIGYEPLCETDLTDGAWHNLKEDLLPHILLAVQEAWDRGYLPDSHNLADYRIGGMNLGWEVPGLNDAELQIRNLSLIYTDYSASEVRYDFNTNGNTEGWTASNVNELNGGPIDGRWLMTVPGSDPMWLSPTLQINAAAYSSISVTMANNGNPVDDSHMQIFWLVSGAANFSETNSAWIRDISNTGGWATYTLDLSEEENWSGLITQIRIDPIESGNDSTIGVDSIVLTP